jgi:antitoxin component of MazEF toxin-antitoxin module
MTESTVAHTTATKWGNALGFRIPKSLQDISNIHDKTKIKIEAEPSRLIITKLPEKLTLEQIFAGWNEEEYEGYDWGEIDKPIGREMI